MEATKATNTTPAASPAAAHVSETPDLLQLKENADRAGLIRSSMPSYIQPKLTVSAPDDQYEHEADAVAERVMRMEDEEEAVQAKFLQKQIQRKCAQCEEEAPVQMKPAGNMLQRNCAQCEQEEEESVQRKDTGNEAGSNEAPPIVHEALASGGQAMDSRTQSF